jgi:hypothetical protein
VTQSVARQDDAPPQSSAARKKTERVMPLWEAAKTRRLRIVAQDPGAPR